MTLSEALLALAEYGAEGVVWLLLGLSVVSIAIMLERTWFFWRRRLDADELAKQIFYMFRAGDLAKARAALVRHSSAECLVLAAGLTKAEQGAEPAAAAMHSARWREQIRMECNLGLLAAVGTSAAWIGLLGTVLGLIGLCDRLGHVPADEAGLAVGLIAGVSHALVATALGIVVALPAVVGSTLLNRRVRTTLAQTDSLMELTLSLIPPWLAAREKAASLAGSQAA